MCYSDIIQEIYALVDQSYKDYQRKLKELYGKEAHEKIMDALNVKKAEERYIYGSYMFGECNTYIDEPIPKTLFYEPYSDRFFESTEYYGAAEPPVRCGESHLSGLTEPLRSL